MIRTMVVQEFEPEKGKVVLYCREHQTLYVIAVAEITSTDCSTLPRKMRVPVKKETQTSFAPAEVAEPEVSEENQVDVDPELFKPIQQPKQP